MWQWSIASQRACLQAITCCSLLTPVMWNQIPINLRKGLYSNLVDHDVGPSHCIEFHGERSAEYFIPFLDREAVPLHCLKRSIVKIKSFLSRTQQRYPSTISSQNTSWALTPPMQENKIANSRCSFHIKFNMSNSAIVDVFVPLISSDLIKVSVVVQFLPLVQNFLNQFKLFFWTSTIFFWSTTKYFELLPNVSTSVSFIFLFLFVFCFGTFNRLYIFPLFFIFTLLTFTGLLFTPCSPNIPAPILFTSMLRPVTRILCGRGC